MAALRRIEAPARWASRWVRDTVFPIRCAGCGRRGEWVCPECLAGTAWVGAIACQRCGVDAAGRCRCRTLAPSVARARSAAWYEGWVREAVIAFKYEGEFARAADLAEWVAPVTADLMPFDLLVPVPLHSRRIAERGYNQAALLAAQIGSRVGCPAEAVLTRVQNTAHQVGLTGEERRQNVAAAFALAPDTQVIGKRVVLVDDVLTTGSTVSACATALIGAGASWVGVVTIARER